MARVTYVGHATVLIDLDGVRLITDPVLRPRVLHLRRVGTVPAAALRGLDAVLLSHAHWDHLDLPSLERFGKELPVVCPNGVSGLLRRKRFTHVTTLDEGEEVRIGGLVVRGVHAEHDGGRGPLGASGELGFVITGSRTMYFAGDTDLFDDLAELGPLDLALVPVTGWGSKVGPGHLDPSGRPRRFACCGHGWPCPSTGEPSHRSAGSGYGAPARVRPVRGRADAGRRGPHPRAGGGSRLLAT